MQSEQLQCWDSTGEQDLPSFGGLMIVVESLSKILVQYLIEVVSWFERLSCDAREDRGL